MKAAIFITFLAAATAAQLPSSSYLPQNSGAPQRPSNTYLPGNQGSQGGFGQQNGFGGGSGGFGGNGNTRAQQEVEKNAQILKLDQDINENGFHYSYETSNGIRAEEAGNEHQTQGGFSYQGDDGNTYSIVFTAGEGGFRPQGDHLPVAPPTPEAILQALEQNARDEAAGIFDDGKYRPDSNANGKTGQGSSSSSGQGYGSANHQGSFNSQTGYRY